MFGKNMVFELWFKSLKASQNAGFFKSTISYKQVEV